MNNRDKIKDNNTKTELAEDMGMQVPEEGYGGNMTSKACGNEVRNAVAEFEKKLIKK